MLTKEQLIDLAQDGDMIWIKPKNAFTADMPSPRYYPDLEEVIGNIDNYIDIVKKKFRTNKHIIVILNLISDFMNKNALSKPQLTSDQYFRNLVGGLLSLIYPGHTAIVHAKNGVKSVIEAWGEGKKNVKIMPINEWYEFNINYMGGPYVFWLGRVKSSTASQRASISDFAYKQLGNPFNFLNFDLADESCYYCSKLCWMAIYDAIKIPIDGMEQTNRVYWVSPKDLIECDGIRLILGDRRDY